jgi:membrane-bound serine protease (ClpP class)
MMRPPTTGAAGMIGQRAVVRAALDPEGQVQLDGELWRAVAEDAPVPAGETVRVTGVDGLTLRVSRAANRS